MAQRANIKTMPVVEYARAHSEQMVQVLVDIALGGDKDSTRVSAAVAVLNRAYGTPTQSLQVTGDAPKSFDMSSLTNDQMRELHSILSIIKPADEVVQPDDMPPEKDLKNVTQLTVVPPPAP